MLQFVATSASIAIWVVFAPAAILGCSSRSSGSLSRTEPAFSVSVEASVDLSQSDSLIEQKLSQSNTLVFIFLQGVSSNQAVLSFLTPVFSSPGFVCQRGGSGFPSSHHRFANRCAFSDCVISSVRNVDPEKNGSLSKALHSW